MKREQIENIVHMVDRIDVNYEPFKLLSDKEKEETINKLSTLTKDQFEQGYNNSLGILYFHYESNYKIIRAKYYNYLEKYGEMSEETENKFMQMNVQNIIGWQDKRDELEEVYLSVSKKFEGGGD